MSKQRITINCTHCGQPHKVTIDIEAIAHHVTPYSQGLMSWASGAASLVESGQALKTHITPKFKLTYQEYELSVLVGAGAFCFVNVCNVLFYAMRLPSLQGGVAFALSIGAGIASGLATLRRLDDGRYERKHEPINVPARQAPKMENKTKVLRLEISEQKVNGSTHDSYLDVYGLTHYELYRIGVAVLEDGGSFSRAHIMKRTGISDHRYRLLKSTLADSGHISSSKNTTEISKKGLAVFRGFRNSYERGQKLVEVQPMLA